MDCDVARAMDLDFSRALPSPVVAVARQTLRVVGARGETRREGPAIS
jgi:hypothetical protein